MKKKDIINKTRKELVSSIAGYILDIYERINDILQPCFPQGEKYEIDISDADIPVRVAVTQCDGSDAEESRRIESVIMDETSRVSVRCVTYYDEGGETTRLRLDIPADKLDLETLVSVATALENLL